MEGSKSLFFFKKDLCDSVSVSVFMEINMCFRFNYGLMVFAIQYRITHEQIDYRILLSSLYTHNIDYDE